MADFITRLAGRVLGAQPVVQPLVAPMFAPEPTSHSNHSLDLEWDSEATTSSGDLDRRQTPSAEEKLPASWDAPPGRPEDTAMAQQGDQRNLPRAAPRAAPRPSQGMSDLQLEPPHPVEPASTKPRIPEYTAMAQQGDQRNWPPATPGRPQRPPDGGGALHPAGAGPARREEGVSTSPRVLPEDLPSGPPV